MNESDSFLRYLAAKKTVDDRALNQHVWSHLIEALRRFPRDRSIRILELGAGIGTMVERIVSQPGLPDMVYSAIDLNGAAIEVARERLTDLPPGVTLDLQAIDLFDFIAADANQTGSWDLVIAHAFLDLLDIEEAVPGIFSLLQPNGYFYFTLNFDGGTVLEPGIEPVFDARVESLYHQTMDERVTNGKPSGDSQTGRHLFQCLAGSGAEILSSGSSDWVVFPGENGYRDDDAWFLKFIINTIHGALECRSELDQEQFRQWISKRHGQIERGELVYIARQLDFFGRRSVGEG